MSRSIDRSCLLFLAVSNSFYACADGSTIDKIYDPYVQLLEKEIEYRVLYQDDSQNVEDGRVRQRFGHGQSVSDQIFLEFYVTGIDEPGESIDIESYEAEVKWQISEQGEYDNDWGLLFELEKEHDESKWEVSTTLIMLREWQGWITTGNFSIIYEWGNDIDNEWETAFSGQVRYRNSVLLEPGIEVYQSQDTQAVGPVLTGLWRLGNGSKLDWEFGVLLGTNSETSDVNWKLNIDYEFQ